MWIPLLEKRRTGRKRLSACSKLLRFLIIRSSPHLNPIFFQKTKTKLYIFIRMKLFRFLPIYLFFRTTWGKTYCQRGLTVLTKQAQTIRKRFPKCKQQIIPSFFLHPCFPHPLPFCFLYFLGLSMTQSFDVLCKFINWEELRVLCLKWC